MKKIISGLTVLVVLLSLGYAFPTKAAVSVTPASGGTRISAGTVGGTWTTLEAITITEGLTNDFAIGTNVTITLKAPTGFEFNTGSTPNVATTTGSDITAGSATVVSGTTTITITVSTTTSSDTLVIGNTTPIQVRPTATNLPTGQICRSGGTATVTGITNCGGGQTNFGTLTEIPAAISNLACVASGSPGAVWLTWADPTGDPKTGYDVRYSTAAITASNYDSAYGFTNNWSAGTAGASRQELVISLTPNIRYYFAIKSNSANGLADISTGDVTCIAPVASAPLEKEAPTSSITDPLDGATILAGKLYTIKGTSSDTGGSSVKTVELSFDGGTTWITVSPKATNATAGFDWEYVWSVPKVGSYNLKTRPTDWVGNIETPGAGITVNVVSELPPTPPTPGKPISQMTAEEIKVKIVEVQQKIIELLTQLIQLIQQQIAELSR